MTRIPVMRKDKTENLDQATEPTGSSGFWPALISGLANQIRDVLGKPNWYDAPPINLTQTRQHVDTGKAAHGGLVAAAEKGAANGVPTLDASIKIPLGQLLAGVAGGLATLDAGTKVPMAQLLAGVANGVATLGADGKLTTAQLGALAITDTFPVASETAMLGLAAQVGDVAVRTDLNRSFILRLEPASTLGNWQELLTPIDAVLSVNGKTGTVSLAAADVGAIASSLRGAANGVAELDGAGLLPLARLPEHGHRFAWDPVRAATTANVDLATGGLLTVDGVVLAAGNRVLVKNQTTGSQNGIYAAASGAWARATDADASSGFVPSKTVTIAEGTAQKDTLWLLSTDGAITLGTTALAFAQASGGGGSVVDASTTQKGVTRLSVAPVTSTEPIALGDNDTSVVKSGTAAGGDLSGTFPNPTVKALGAFSAFKNANVAGVASGTVTKVTFPAEEFDTHNWFDTTNNRYTPQKAGLYEFSCHLLFGGISDGSSLTLMLYKNGFLYKKLANNHTGSVRQVGINGGAVAQANGTTDHFEVFFIYNSTAASLDLLSGSSETYFQGNYVGAAA